MASSRKGSHVKRAVRASADTDDGRSGSVYGTGKRIDAGSTERATENGREFAWRRGGAEMKASEVPQGSIPARCVKNGLEVELVESHAFEMVGRTSSPRLHTPVTGTRLQVHRTCSQLQSRQLYLHRTSSSRLHTPRSLVRQLYVHGTSSRLHTPVTGTTAIRSKDISAPVTGTTARSSQDISARYTRLTGTTAIRSQDIIFSAAYTPITETTATRSKDTIFFSTPVAVTTAIHSQDIFLAPYTKTTAIHSQDIIFSAPVTGTTAIHSNDIFSAPYTPLTGTTAIHSQDIFSVPYTPVTETTAIHSKDISAPVTGTTSTCSKDIIFSTRHRYDGYTFTGYHLGSIHQDNSYTFTEHHLLGSSHGRRLYVQRTTSRLHTPQSQTHVILDGNFTPSLQSETEKTFSKFQFLTRQLPQSPTNNGQHAPETTVNPIRVDRGSCSVTTRTIRSFYKSCLSFYLLLENSIATVPFLLQFYRGHSFNLVGTSVALGLFHIPETGWSARVDAVKAVFLHYLEIKSALENIICSDSSFKTDLLSAVKLYESIIFVSEMRQGQFDEIEDQATAFA
ncbi:hypothetical protein Hamer_G015938 [Homarus americanus]|uniref:Uncharacterized protein n=1 Tax=Homarus americanus TaxID=6706 RepID=A0A8J5JBG9_HOMAM|nr:hypothetical protein Hamer_G015938 [Homarus americanus]